MIDLEGGHIHLSYEQGSGGTSLFLTIAEEFLRKGKKIVWLSKNLPDKERTAQIFEKLENKELENITFIEIENDLEESSKILKYFTKRMMSEDIVFIDDWCSKDGRAAKKDINALESIVRDTEKTKIIASSTSYQNINNGKNIWESRGGRSIKDIFKTIFLYRKSEMNNIRIIEDGNSIREIALVGKGFE